MTDQTEVDRTNFEGKLHPSQRRAVMARTGFGKLLLVLGVAAAVSTPLSSQYKLSSLPRALFWLPAILLLVCGLWIAGRPMVELLRGRVLATSGWTNVEVGGQPTGTITGQLSLDYCVTLGTRTFKVSRDVYVRVQPDQDNTAFLTPITHRVVNVAPTRR
jgi:hypothetical protein